jgi:hypothetical protein
LSGQHKIPIGPLVAMSGAVLLIVSLFLDWYEGLTGWTVFEIVDLVLVGLALGTIVVLAGGLGVLKAAFNAAAASIGTAVALVIVVTQVINDPPAVAGGGGPDRDIGIWLALGGAGLMLAGAVLATTHISLAVETRRRDTGPDEPTAPLNRTEPREKPSGGPERP